MICRELAVRLTDHVNWTPQNADRFFIPRAEIAESVFIVSDMVVELIHNQGEANFHFNGTTEWALDSVESDAAVWLPSEEQLREQLGDAFLSLDRVGDGYVVTVNGPAGAHHTAAMAVAADAYALALLHLSGGDESLPTDRLPLTQDVA
ncbi:pilus assembly protein CpaE [Microlunatus elymi]|uniref:pilus assembly protein CpaE n=1 Tax=Microlunatus elymi TaxID=2596828 RepID=UPI001AEF9138|nr:pilus assembly protein CpaE [Microlunatus elymi]